MEGVTRKRLSDEFLDSLYKLFNDSLNKVTSSALDKKRKRNCEDDEHKNKAAIKSVNSELKETISFIDDLDRLTGKKPVSVCNSDAESLVNGIKKGDTRTPVPNGKEAKSVTTKSIDEVKPKEISKTTVNKRLSTPTSTTIVVNTPPNAVSINKRQSIPTMKIKTTSTGSTLALKLINTTPKARTKPTVTSTVSSKTVTSPSVVKSKPPPNAPSKAQPKSTVLSTNNKLNLPSTAPPNAPSKAEPKNTIHSTNNKLNSPSTTPNSHTSTVQKSNKSSEFMCFHCNIQFNDKPTFFEHLKNHEKKGYKCTNCDKTFNGKLEWNCHVNFFCKNKQK